MSKLIKFSRGVRFEGSHNFNRLFITSAYQPENQWSNLNSSRASLLNSALQFKSTSLGRVSKTTPKNYAFSYKQNTFSSSNSHNDQVNFHQETDKELLESLSTYFKNYRSLTWYSLPKDYQLSFELATNKLCDKSTFLESPISLKIITDQGKGSSGINLLQCLLESPFGTDFEKYFQQARLKLGEQSNISSNICFSYGDYPKTENVQKETTLASLNSYEESIDSTSVFKLPIDFMNENPPLEIYLEEGFGSLLKLDLFVEQVIVVIEDLSSLDRLCLALDKLAYSLLTPNIWVVINSDSSNESVIRHIINSKFSSIVATQFKVNIDQALHGHQIFKKSPSNASEFQLNWIGSGMQEFRDIFKRKFSAAELNIQRQMMFYNQIEQFLTLSEANVKLRINESQEILEDASCLLNEYSSFKNEIVSQIESIIKHSLETNRIISVISSSKLRFSMFYKFPSYSRKLRPLVFDLLYYDAELKLVQAQGWIAAQLQEFWNSRVVNFVAPLSNRPTISLPNMNLQSFYPVFSPAFMRTRQEINLAKLIEYTQEAQSTLLFKLALQQIGCFGGSALFIQSSIHPEITPVSILPLASLISIYYIYRFWIKWNLLGDQLTIKIKQLDNNLSKELMEAFQEYLNSQISHPLTKTISNQIIPYHQKLSKQLQATKELSEKILSNLKH